MAKVNSVIARAVVTSCRRAEGPIAEKTGRRCPFLATEHVVEPDYCTITGEVVPPVLDGPLPSCKLGSYDIVVSLKTDG
jgi:hypothetical protein